MIGNILGAAAVMVPLLIGGLGWARSVDQRLREQKSEIQWIKNGVRRLLASRGIPDIIPFEVDS